jgi:hypothetical protein
MMREDIKAWYGDVLKEAAMLHFTESRLGGRYCDNADARKWITLAEAALGAVFPESHAIRTSWARIYQIPKSMHIGEVCDQFIAAFEAAYDQIQNDRLGSLVDIIRQESEDELLDQASTLAKGGYVAAATVIAGGALETHLRHYVTKHGITVGASGSISAYNDAVAAARKTNASLYSSIDVKQVTTWGGYRNDAAHSPGTFQRSTEDANRMIEGIREFIARTT